MKFGYCISTKSFLMEMYKKYVISHSEGKSTYLPKMNIPI